MLINSININTVVANFKSEYKTIKKEEEKSIVLRIIGTCVHPQTKITKCAILIGFIEFLQLSFPDKSFSWNAIALFKAANFFFDNIVRENDLEQCLSVARLFAVLFIHKWIGKDELTNIFNSLYFGSHKRMFYFYELVLLVLKGVPAFDQSMILNICKA